MALRPGTALLLITLGYLLKLLTAETQCENIYQDFSGCILKLGENMAKYEEEAEEDEVNQSLLQGLQVVCG
ncbi:hypothetical protein NXF25_009566 [Crotalus adamanteus]|uniref:Uncharacterized protein n=2 Tax=Crotalus TaxID=8728 RepID=A0AAW1BRI1_CROAD